MSVCVIDWADRKTSRFVTIIKYRDAKFGIIVAENHQIINFISDFGCDAHCPYKKIVKYVNCVCKRLINDTTF